MADRYYLPAAQVQEISELLDREEANAPLLVAEIRRLVFATAIPDDMADDIERQLKNAENGFSI